MVLKSEGKREPFDRDKILRSMQIALRKRPISEEQLERMVNSIVRRLESSGDNEVHANQIGEVVMESLAELDPVAYVRYASVYKDFREAADFNEFLEEIGRDPSELPLPGKKKSTKKK